MPRLLFGAWAPDVAPNLTNNLRVAKNVYAAANGYRPIGQFQLGAAGALPLPCIGAAAFVSPQGQTTIVAGTQTGLYRVFSNGFQQIGDGYGGQERSRWRFAQFGGLAIATNGADPMVKIDLTNAATAPLGGTPPRFENLAVVKDFLVGAVMNGDVQTLAWSGINNAEQWSFGENQSDFNIMPSGGRINGMFGGEYGLILQRGRITRMTYVGDNVVFQFDEISSNVGCVSKNSTAQWGNLGFFLADTGFMMWDGSGLKPIGQERIDRYFKSLYGTPALDKMSTAIDPVNTIVMWSMGNLCFIYNWLLDRWTMSDLAIEIVFSGFYRDITLDEQDPVVGSPDDVLDTPGLSSFDDERFRGGDPRFYVIRADNRIGTLTGAPLPAELALTNQEMAPGRDARIRIIRPLSDVESGLTTTIDARNRLGAAATTTTYSGVRPNGDVPVRARGRYAQIGQQMAAGANWSFHQGIDVSVAAGARQ